MQIFESIKKYNDKIAIVDNDGLRTTTYSELDYLSEKLAAKLISDGIKEGSSIILKFDRCREFIISIYAVLKIKCVFVTVLPEYPEERVEFIKKDSNAKFLLTIDYFNDIEKYSIPSNYNYDIDENALACIVYTSGSTGKPKGILYDRKGIDALAKRNYAVYDLKEIAWGCMSPFSFVAALYEILTVLNAGGTIHLLSDEDRSNVKNIEEYYEKNKLTCGFMTIRMLMQYKNKDKYLKRMICGGEKISSFYTDEFEVMNMYGQGEALVICMFKIDKKYEDTPIGKAFPDSKIYLLDENGNEVANGSEGEICVVGDYSLGYLNLDENTKKTYEKMQDGQDGKVRIHTGDIGKYDQNGNLVYINRKDNMIKLHGQRIEPGEIEHTINIIQGIEASIVKAFDNDDGTMTLAVFYTGKEYDKKVIIENINKKLPSYMIPSVFVHIDKLPINQNGKVDRKSLKLPNNKMFLKEYVKPTTDVEEKLCHSFEKLFGIERIGIDDNFFELGGNSLNATNLVSISEIEELTPQIIFEGETVKGIAALLNEKRVNKPKIQKSNVEINRCSMSLSQIYQYEICKCTNQPLQNMAGPFYYKLPKNTNINKLKNAIYKLVNEHQIYKMSVDLDNEELFVNSKEFIINETNITESEFENYRLDAFNKKRDYKKDYLFEAEIITVDNNYKYLRLYIDHLIYDGISIFTLLKTISSNYDGTEGVKEEFSIFDEINYETNIQNTDFYKSTIEYFDSLYTNLEESKLLKKEPNKHTGGKLQEILADISMDELNEYFVKHHISVLTYFMFALDLSIRKYFDTNNFTYMNIYNGRYDKKLMKAHGCFAKGVFVKSLDLNESSDIETLLKNLQNNYQKTLYYDVISFNKLLSKYKNIRSGINFNYKEDIETVFEIENEKLNSDFFADFFKFFKLYVDMDISLSKSNNKYYMMVNTIRLDDKEAQDFVKIYDQYCHSLLKCKNINEIGVN